MKTKRYFYVATALFMGALAFASCSDDEEGNGGNGGNGGNDSTAVADRYKDRTYGNEAIDACADVVLQLQRANTTIGSSQLTADQEVYLRNVLNHFVDDVVVPTYTKLADDVENLESTLKGLTVSTITQAQVDEACRYFKQARANWELSEAFLGGAATDFDVDPTIDSWPLNRTSLLSYFNSGMPADQLGDQSILGFHALEFILFRDGQPRKVAEFQGYDSYKNFGGVSGAQELQYAQTVCTLLKQRTFQLQIAWEGVTTENQDRVNVVAGANLDTTTQNGLSYGDNVKGAGVNSRSTFPRLQDAITQVLSHDEGSAAAIANEVGTAKIANPFSAGDISYVESPYSYNSITDFQDNILSIRNVWYGSTDGSIANFSFHNFFASVSGGDATNTAVEGAFNDAVEKIGNMPAPFVKYVSTIWNLAFEDDNTYEEY